MAARATRRPRAVSISTPARPAHSMRVTGLDSCTGKPSPSLAITVPRPWRQYVSLSRSAAWAKSAADTSARSLAQAYGPSTNSTVLCQSNRSFGSPCAAGMSSLPRPASPMARLDRTIEVRKSSSSVARANRRPIRSCWLVVAGKISKPALVASAITGLRSGWRMKRAPMSNGAPNVCVSVKQRPPIRPVASISAKRARVPEMRRAAAMPAAPAPMIAISTLSADWAARAGAAAAAAENADAARNRRRVRAARVRAAMVNRLLIRSHHASRPRRPQFTAMPQMSGAAA